jgi:hypothetical protein|tara:strand:- start:99 stop:236 length:138 start_codon:yes stop_codon:yes gene_type:complete
MLEAAAAFPEKPPPVFPEKAAAAFPEKAAAAFPAPQETLSEGDPV